MNRRKAIFRISLAGAAIAAAAGGYKWWEITKTPDLAYLPKAKGLIAELAETIIPTTDTPGAKSTGVHDFIIKMITDCSDIKTQNKFVDGLKDLQAYSKDKFDKPFEQCGETDREKILRHFEKEGAPYSGIIGKVQRRFLGKSFFTSLKEYTVEGYCTSQIGATRALVYVPVPGKYEGCITIQPGQKAWATI